MISRVRGTVVSRETDRVELLATSGVVYEIHVPLTVFQRLPDEGSELELRTAYVVRDEIPSLYGFLERGEHDLFHRLMKVQKVGPRLAMALMSSYHAGRLARGIAEKDAKLLSRVSGVGKKTAERIVLELSDKVSDLAVASADSGPEAKLVRPGRGGARRPGLQLHRGRCGRARGGLRRRLREHRVTGPPGPRTARTGMRPR